MKYIDIIYEPITESQQDDDFELEEDLADSLDQKALKLKNQAKVIANRKRHLKNKEGQDKNREAARKLATNNLNAKSIIPNADI